ncbi:hypothetical protein PUN28_012550 [Cardiocondyla obscurior]|uniref:Uncharacterized protein n=1 Tax=Cardiocondyla obscurior TaxID=286306 RepID=A0AAW2FEK3_9HYME
MSFPSQRDVQSRINTNSSAGKWRASIPVAIFHAIFCTKQSNGPSTRLSRRYLR